MNEETVVKTVALPCGRDWEWYGDLNVVALAPHLDECGRDRALSEVQAFWRRSCLRIVGADDALATQPLNVPSSGVQPKPNIRQVIEAL